MLLRLRETPFCDLANRIARHQSDGGKAGLIWRIRPTLRFDSDPLLAFVPRPDGIAAIIKLHAGF